MEIEAQSTSPCHRHLHTTTVPNTHETLLSTNLQAVKADAEWRLTLAICKREPMATL